MIGIQVCTKLVSTGAWSPVGPLDPPLDTVSINDVTNESIHHFSHFGYNSAEYFITYIHLIYNCGEATLKHKF